MHGLYWLVANLGRDGPLLLAVDDVHLADKASLRFFVYLLKRIEDLPILALFARRTGDAATDRALVDELSVAQGAFSIAPRALSSDGAGRLLEAMVGVPQDDEVVTRCHGLSGGSPFLLVELARDLRSEGVAPAVGTGAPAAVTHAILVRLGRLGTDVVDLAKAVVILGDRCALTEAAQLAGQTLETAGDAASAMMRSDILAPDGDLRFVHPLVRSAVESDLTPTDRLLGHAHAARLLVDAGAKDERVATHLMLAAPQRNQRSIDALLGAANLALTRGEPEAAAARLERALLESPSDNQLPEILTLLGESRLLAADGARALEHLERASQLTADPVRKAAIALPLSKALLATQGPAAAAELLERSADRLGNLDRELLLELETEIALAGAFDAAQSRRLWCRLDAFGDLKGDTLGERRVLAVLSFRHQFDVTADVSRTREVALRALAGGDLVRQEGLNYLTWGAALTTLVSTGALKEAEVIAGIALEQRAL